MKKGTIRVATYSGNKVPNYKEVQGLLDACGLGVHKALDSDEYKITHLQSGYQIFGVGKLKQARQAVCMLSKLIDWSKDKHTINEELRSKRVELSIIKGELGL